MKLKSIILENFRSYKNQIKIEVSDLTALIGKNDIGKSTILEALEIFFNNSVVKIDPQDACVNGSNKEVLIGCEFSELPLEVILDTSSTTNLCDEFLLNSEGFLEIHKVFDCSNKTIKESVYACAYHPSANGSGDLLQLKNTELKKRLNDLHIEKTDIDLRSNSAIRKAIWNSFQDLSLEKGRIMLNKEDAKKIWESLKNELPIFALFQADRSSKDEDAEVQDPMKLAIAEAVRTVNGQLEEIKDIVKEKATEVAQRTLDKLKEMDPSLARELSPHFKVEPKWDSLFKLALTGENQIPINKRGSGVRRLILLNFFRAEAERRQKEANSPGIIYAIEEPETSQHPNNQKLIIEALIQLSEQANCQIMLTTHVPGLAGLLPIESIRYIDKDELCQNRISCGKEDLYLNIAQELGVLPDKEQDEQVRVILCLEGPHDISFLQHISSLLNSADNSLPNLSTDPRVAVLPLGGGTLKQWVNNDYLKKFNLPEIHIYDRDTQNPPKYQQECDRVNARSDNSWATITQKRELENYLHPDLIKDELKIEIEFNDLDDVPTLIMNAINNDSNHSLYKISEKKVKKLLNDQVASKMTHNHLAVIDPNEEIKSWFIEIMKRF
jgi:predicted ATP-dependent endonuclease of OLD family